VSDAYGSPSSDAFRGVASLLPVAAHCDAAGSLASRTPPSLSPPCLASSRRNTSLYRFVCGARLHARTTAALGYPTNKKR